MQPVKFVESNVTFAEDQPEYQPLPAHWNGVETVTSCWQFTWRDRVRILFGAPLWLRQLTFGQALQPQLPQLEKPEMDPGDAHQPIG